jgi:TonB family protein
MSDSYSPGRTNFGSLPEPEGRAASFLTSSIVNLALFGIVLYVSATASQVIQRHNEMTVLIAPITPPPVQKYKPPPPPKIKPEPRQIEMPKPKPIQMEAKLAAPKIQQPKPEFKLALQPKPALPAAMPAQNNQVRPTVMPVHLGQTFGVTPNPNAVRPATIAAIGNPYGGMQGQATAPRGVVGSTGIGYSVRPGSGGGGGGPIGRVASVGMPGLSTAAAVPVMASAPVQSTSVEVLSKPPAQYTSEARQLRIQGDVVLSVTFLASGQVVVHGVVRGLGHGLDEEAMRVAEQIHFRPATDKGRPIDVTTHITITFQQA